MHDLLGVQQGDGRLDSSDSPDGLQREDCVDGGLEVGEEDVPGGETQLAPALRLCRGETGGGRGVVVEHRGGEGGQESLHLPHHLILTTSSILFLVSSSI